MPARKLHMLTLSKKNQDKTRYGYNDHVSFFLMPTPLLTLTFICSMAWVGVKKIDNVQYLVHYTYTNISTYINSLISMTL